MPHFINGQSLDEICALNGIWVAKEYKEAFDQNRSAVKSRSAFNPMSPVALRINCKETFDGKWNLGYARLHDHSIHPEISGTMRFGEKERSEQGNFLIQLSDSSLAQKLIVFNDGHVESTDYRLSWNFEGDTSLSLFAFENSYQLGYTVDFVRVTSVFSEDYQYPNPMYLYTRTKALTGLYSLHIPSNSDTAVIRFSEDGSIHGYKPFSELKTYLSTDVYCGPEATEDLILLCKMDWAYEPDSECKHFVLRFHENEPRSFSFFHYKYNYEAEPWDIEPYLKVGDVAFEFKFIQD